jgi:D-glycero-beta-D-manno-heptose-7-phosphate kinase
MTGAVDGQLEKNAAAALMKAARGVAVAVVGDVMLDRMVSGDVRRISPEAPVPVVEVSGERHVPGGAANVAANLAALGAEVELCGVVGRDGVGAKLAAALARAGVEFSGGVWGAAGVPTIEKTRVWVRGQQLCRLDREGAAEAYRIEGQRKLRRVFAAIGRSRALVLSDYAKGAFSEENVPLMLERARSGGVPVLVDAKPGPLALPWGGVEVFKCNRSEALQFAGMAGRAWDATTVCRRIHRRFGPAHLVITLGAEGMLLASGPKVCRILPTQAREVFDVCGAGDTAIAAIALGVASGTRSEEAVALANAAAGVVVAKRGTAAASAAEVTRFLNI